MPPSNIRPRAFWLMLATGILIVAARIWLAVDIPLTDTTEARYGEMARKMVETSNWTMPQHDYGVPYLAKPPLAFWLSAGGIELLGAHELGPRILILLTAIGFLIYFHRWLNREIGPGAAASGVMMLLGSVLFFVAMAAVMTDLVLVACVDVALLAFWQRMQRDSRAAEWVLFIAIGLGMLTKGPLAAFLVIVPILLWAVVCGRLAAAWRTIPWVKGALISAVVAAPWYGIAEWQYPGFLRYFLIGENLQRFLVSNWQGDLYGSVHEAPHGLIWLFLWIAALPWSAIGIAVLWRMRHSIPEQWRSRRELIVFALSAAIVPMLLFTAAKNIIFPYALPALAPGVIAVLALLGEDLMTWPFVTGVAASAGTAMLALTLACGILHGRIEQESERELVTAAATQFNLPLDELYYWRHRYFSADYYSAGRASRVDDTDDLESLLERRRPFALAMEDADFAALPERLKSSLQFLGDYSKKSIYGPIRAAGASARAEAAP